MWLGILIRNFKSKFELGHEKLVAFRVENLSRHLKVKIFFLKDVCFMVFVGSVLVTQKECTKN